MSDGELKKRIDTFAKFADEVHFSKVQIQANMYQILDDAKSDFPKAHATLYYKEFGKLPETVLTYNSEEIVVWFEKWFGST